MYIINKMKKKIHFKLFAKLYIVFVDLKNKRTVSPTHLALNNPMNNIEVPNFERSGIVGEK